MPQQNHVGVQRLIGQCGKHWCAELLGIKSIQTSIYHPRTPQDVIPLNYLAGSQGSVGPN